MTWQEQLKGEGFTARISKPEELEGGGHIPPQSRRRGKEGTRADDHLTFST